MTDSYPRRRAGISGRIAVRRPTAAALVVGVIASGVLAAPMSQTTALAAPMSQTWAAGAARPAEPPASFEREPADTQVHSLQGTNVVYQYGQPVPSFDGWRTPEPTRHYLPLDGQWRFRFDPQNVGLSEGWQSSVDTGGWGASPFPRPGICSPRPDSARWTARRSAGEPPSRTASGGTAGRSASRGSGPATWSG